MKTKNFEGGAITPDQAILLASVFGAWVGKALVEGKYKTIVENEDTNELMVDLLELVAFAADKTEETRIAVHTCYNVHAKLNYLAAKQGIAPGSDLELLAEPHKPGEVGN